MGDESKVLMELCCSWRWHALCRDCAGSNEKWSETRVAVRASCRRTKAWCCCLVYQQQAYTEREQRKGGKRVDMYYGTRPVCKVGQRTPLAAAMCNFNKQQLLGWDSLGGEVARRRVAWKVESLQSHPIRERRQHTSKGWTGSRFRVR